MKILIVEDDNFYSKTIKKFLQKHILLEKVHIIDNLEKLNNINYSEYDLCIAEYFFEGIKGKHLDAILDANLKTIILTELDKEFFESKYKDKAIDYIIKEGFFTLNYLLLFIKRFKKNRYIRVLTVDDSLLVRKRISDILKFLNYNVITAKDGVEALEVLKNNDIQLVITDINMPNMNGFELVKNIRKKYTIEELPIIVVSSNANEELIQTLKIGANDFIHKPFLKEELIIRVNNTLEVFERLQSVKKAVQIDALTQVYNRYYFENYLDNLFNTYEIKSIAMLDIDHFKKINDTYGHQYGDEVLKDFANHIRKNIRKTDIVIRYGGEEFLIFFPNTTKKEALIAVNKIKSSLENSKYNYTFSAGIADEGESLIEMIKLADSRLYKAKENGRNLIVIE